MCTALAPGNLIKNKAAKGLLGPRRGGGGGGAGGGTDESMQMVKVSCTPNLVIPQTHHPALHGVFVMNVGRAHLKEPQHGVMPLRQHGQRHRLRPCGPPGAAFAAAAAADGPLEKPEGESACALGGACDLFKDNLFFRSTEGAGASALAVKRKRCPCVEYNCCTGVGNVRHRSQYTKQILPTGRCTPELSSLCTWTWPASTQQIAEVQFRVLTAATHLGRYDGVSFWEVGPVQQLWEAPPQAPCQ